MGDLGGEDLGNDESKVKTQPEQLLRQHHRCMTLKTNLKVAGAAFRSHGLKSETNRLR